MRTPVLLNIFTCTEQVNAQTTPTPIMGGVDKASVSVVYSDATPGAATFVAANVKTNVQSPASSITVTAHGFVTGLKAPLTGTNLPTGLSATNYWIIVIDANTVSLATSYANAVAGTKVAITGAGTTADAALTPSVLGSAVFKLQASNDNSNWVDLTSMTVTISAAGISLFRLGSIDYAYLRCNLAAVSAGALTINATLYGVPTYIKQ